MKKTFLNLVVSITILITINSCSSIYIPSTTNIPLLEEKGEKQVELTASTNSLHLSTNYAFSDKYALMTNGGLSYGNFSKHYDVFETKGSRIHSGGYLQPDIGNSEFCHRYGEVGIGRYNIFQTKIKLEVFTGVGYGVAKDQLEQIHYDADYYMGFVQLNFGSTLRNINFGCALRVASSYYDYTISRDSVQISQNYNSGIFENVNFSLIHIEPISFVRIGTENLKFVFQWGFSFYEPITLPDKEFSTRGIDHGYVNTTNLHFSIGVNYKFGQKKE